MESINREVHCNAIFFNKTIFKKIVGQIWWKVTFYILQNSLSVSCFYV